MCVKVREPLCGPAFSIFQILKIIVYQQFFFSFKGEKVDTNRLQNILESFGIELNPYEYERLLNVLPTGK